MNYLVDVPLIRVVKWAMRICGKRIPMISNVGNHEYTCWLKVGGTLMGYIWETDNLVKNFTLSGGLFRPKQTVHASQGVKSLQRGGKEH